MALFNISLTKKQTAILRPLFDRLETEKFGKPGAVIMQCCRKPGVGITGYAHGGYLSHECAKKVHALMLKYGKKEGKEEE